MEVHQLSQQHALLTPSRHVSIDVETAYKTDMCADVHVNTGAQHVCSHLCRHVCRHVYRHMHRHVLSNIRWAAWLGINGFMKDYNHDCTNDYNDDYNDDYTYCYTDDYTYDYTDDYIDYYTEHLRRRRQ